jgi:3-oxoacyl-[acyl-carrier protein] reductase
MNLDLRGKTALVCGSTQGIGKASAIELALLGATVVLMARNREKLEAVCRELPVGSGQVHEYIVADFTSVEEVKREIEKFVKDHDIDILVNNTGGPPGGLASEAKLEDFTKAFETHLLCNQALASAVTPSMKKRKFGRIINVISTSVKIPIFGLGVSNTIRGAVASWSKTLSLELAQYGITVNNILPGATLTARLEAIAKNNAEKSGKSVEDILDKMKDEIPARRIGDAHEVAAAVAFLASPAAAYINGINIPVDGGRTGSL